MKTVGQRLYSVLTRKEVVEKMMQQIEQISEVFSLSKSDATEILIRVRWNSFQASDRLGDNKEKFLAELQLVRILDSSQENESVSSSADRRTHSDYESYLLRSFVESNKETLKWCGAQGCDYALERQDDAAEDDESSVCFGVVCLCGHTFCWNCPLESHRPADCDQASEWLKSQLDGLKNDVWKSKNTKRCPCCDSPVQKIGDSDLRLVTCICSCSFCWRCFRSKEDHNGKWNCCDVSAPPKTNREKEDNQSTQVRLLRQWETLEEELEKSKSKFKAIEENGIPSLSAEDTNALREARLLLVQCRLVLKWSFVFEYNMSDYQSTKKQYVKHLRGEATKILARHSETLQMLMNQALSSGGNFSYFKLKLSASTATTGDYFHHFVETLEDGLPEVKVDSCENASVCYLFCDRCSFQNSWSDQQCKMCLVPLDPPPTPNVASDNHNTASVSSDHQQVQNNP